MSSHATPPTTTEDQRALAPIRWGRPTPGVLLGVGIWALGALVGAVVPLILLGADPYEYAEPSQVGIALTFSLLGSLIMVFSAYLLYRKSGSIGAAILAFVPSFVLATFGILMVTMKLLYGE